MRVLCLITCLALAPVPLASEEAQGDGLSLMERGAELFLEGFLDEMEPALEGLQGFAEAFGPAMAEMMAQMGPALSDLLEQVDDLSNYAAPEILPNGDIIIRRKPEAPEWTPEEAPIEL